MNKESKSKKMQKEVLERTVIFILTIGVSGIDFLRHHLDDKGQVASGTILNLQEQKSQPT